MTEVFIGFSKPFLARFCFYRMAVETKIIIIAYLIELHIEAYMIEDVSQIILQ